MHGYSVPQKSVHLIPQTDRQPCDVKMSNGLCLASVGRATMEGELGGLGGTWPVRGDVASAHDTGGELESDKDQANARLRLLQPQILQQLLVPPLAVHGQKTRLNLPFGLRACATLYASS